MRKILYVIGIIVLLGCVKENEYDDNILVEDKNVVCTNHIDSPDGVFKCKSIRDDLPVNGKVVKYYSRKKVRSEYFMIDGKANGLLTRYDTNGRVMYKANFVDGKPDGLTTSYYPNGQVREESYYKDGKLNGLSKFYYENGQLQEERTHINNEVNGKQNFYYENGQLEQEGACKNNELDGKVKFYNSDGTLAFEVTYDMGRVLPGSTNKIDIKEAELRLLYRNTHREDIENCLSSIELCPSYTCSDCDKCKKNLNTWRVLTIERNGVLLVNFAENPLPIFLYTKKKYLSGEEIKTDNYFERAGMYEYKSEIFDEIMRVPSFRETTIQICN